MVSVGVKKQVTVSGSSFLFTDSPARTAVLGLLLATATIAVYLPVHNHPFADLDDPKYVTHNSHIKDGLTRGMVFWALTHSYALNWHPLTWASHALDVKMFGLDPAGPHDENVLLHAVNALLLFWVLKRATGYAGRSFMVAALFALHPLNVESVAWISERKTMLSTLFFLLALGAYRWYVSHPGIRRYMVVAGLFGLGLMCKPQIIMFPLVLLVWDYWPLRRMFASDRQSRMGDALTEVMPAESFWWLTKEKAPLFFLSLVDAALTLIAQHVFEQPQPYPLWNRIENAIVSYARYVAKAFWPSSLSAVYPYLGKGVRWWQVAAAFFLMLVITALAVRARRHRYLIVGWLWFVIMLVPTIGLIQVCGLSMADRYAYVSFVGLYLMVSWGVGGWATERQLPKLLLPSVSAAALLALTLVTYRQVGFWSDNVMLWAHSAEVTRGNSEAELLEAIALDAKGRNEQAAQHYFLAWTSNPTDPMLNLRIAAYERASGNLAVAIEYYQMVLRHAWSSEQRTEALINMADAYRRLGDTASADECLAKIKTLPQRTVDWQGAWWKKVLPLIREYFHHGGSQAGRN
jgi:hypothetical protein